MDAAEGGNGWLMRVAIAARCDVCPARVCVSTVLPCSRLSATVALSAHIDSPKLNVVADSTRQSIMCGVHARAA
jgi:hypothetical protein